MNRVCGVLSREYEKKATKYLTCTISVTVWVSLSPSCAKPQGSWYSWQSFVWWQWLCQDWELHATSHLEIHHRRQLKGLPKLSSSQTTLKIWPDRNTLTADGLVARTTVTQTAQSRSVKLESTFHADLVGFLWLQTNLSFKNRCKNCFST